MKNYFFGINRNAHVSSISREKNLFINDNKIRFSMPAISSTTPVQPVQPQQRTQPTAPAAENGAGKVTNNGQSIVASESQFFSGSMSLQEKLDSVKRMVGNDAFAKLSPQAFNALASGKDVQLQIQQTAPERRNLFIASFVTALQLAGGMAGAAYSEELGNYMKDRASKDADFVTKYGNNYKMNLFGGAEARETIITANVLENSPTIPVEQAKKVNNDIAMQGVKNVQLQAQREATQTEDPTRLNMSIGDQAKSTATYGYAQQSTGNFLEGDSTATQQSFDRLREAYGIGGAVAKGKDGNQTVSSIFIYGTKGENYLSDINTLKGNGKTDAQNQEILKQRQQGAKDYLTLAASAGVITQDQLAQAGNDPKKLVALFKEAEQTLKSRYGDISGTVKDGFLGAHHMMMMQRAISDKIQYNQGGALALTSIANEITDPNGAKQSLTEAQKASALEATGKMTLNGAQRALIAVTDTSSLSTAQKNERNELISKVNSGFESLSSEIKGGNVALIATGAEKIQKDNMSIKSTVASTAKGVYAKDNQILANNLNSIDGKVLFNPKKNGKEDTRFTGVSESLKSSRTTDSNATFSSQIQNLINAVNNGQIKAPQTQTTGVQMSFEGKKGDIETVANQMAQKASSFEGKSKIEGFSLDTFTKGIQDQLKADGITSIGGKKVEELTNEDIVNIGNQLAQNSNPVAIEGGTSEAQEKIKSTFKAVANLDTQVKSNNITADKRIADGKGIFDVKGLSGALKDFQDQVNVINGKNSPTSRVVNTVSDEAERKVIGGAVEKLKDDLRAQGITSLNIGDKSIKVDDLDSAKVNELALLKRTDVTVDRTGKPPEKKAELDAIDQNIGALLNLAISINQNQNLLQQRQSELDLGIVGKANDISTSANTIGDAKAVALVGEISNRSNPTTKPTQTDTTQPNTGASTTPTTSSAANESKAPEAPTQMLSEEKGVAPLQDKDIAKKTGWMSNLQELSKALAQLSDMVTLKLLEEADKMLKKAMNDAANDGVFNYGFTGANYGRITTQDSLVQTYQSVSSIGGRKDEQGKTIGGIAGGLTKIKEYEDLRKQEAQNPKFSIDKALDIAKEQTGKSINGDFSKLNGLVKDSKIDLSNVAEADKLVKDIGNKIKFLEANNGASPEDIAIYKGDLSKLNALVIDSKRVTSDGALDKITGEVDKIAKVGGSEELQGKVKDIKVLIEEANKLRGGSNIEDYTKKVQEISAKYEELDKLNKKEHPTTENKSATVPTETDTKK